MRSALKTQGLALAVLTCACAHSTTIQGQLSVASPSLGNWTLTPNRCGPGNGGGMAFLDTGAKQVFVAVRSLPGPVVLESQRKSVILLLNLDAPTGLPVTIDSSTCRTFDFTMKSDTGAGVGINCADNGGGCDHVYADHSEDGVLSLDCPVPGGGQVRGDVTFSCHYWGE